MVEMKVINLKTGIHSGITVLRGALTNWSMWEREEAKTTLEVRGMKSG